VKTPRIDVMSFSLVEIYAPKPPKSAPYEIKRTLKPRTNKTEPRSTRPRLFEKPAAYEMYPGTKGRTHGDRKEINPARSAIGKAVIK
jgi:hypothetical protein